MFHKILISLKRYVTGVSRAKLLKAIFLKCNLFFQNRLKQCVLYISTLGKNTECRVTLHLQSAVGFGYQYKGPTEVNISYSNSLSLLSKAQHRRDLNTDLGSHVLFHKRYFINMPSLQEPFTKDKLNASQGEVLHLLP